MVLNCDSHQSLSENKGSQSESNEDPIRTYQKREDLSKPYRSLGEELRFSIYYCKAGPPPKKKIGVGLYYCRCNIIRCCLSPVEINFIVFRFVWRLACLLLIECPSAFCSVGWLLDVLLAVAEFLCFRASGRFPCAWLYWIFCRPLRTPHCPFRLSPTVSARKQEKLWSLQPPLLSLININ